MRVATDLLDSDVVEIEGDVPEAAEDNADGAAAPPSTDTRSALWRATQLGLAIVVALAVLVGWLGFRAYQSDQGRAQRSQFLEAARQTALNLTTIDWQKAESDVQRILDGATGSSTTISPSGRSRSSMWSSKAGRPRLARSPRPGWSRRQPGQPLCWWR